MKLTSVKLPWGLLETYCLITLLVTAGILLILVLDKLQDIGI